MSDLVLAIAKALSDTFGPLRVGLFNKQEFEALLFRHGWDVDVDEADLDAVFESFAVEDLMAAVLEAVDEATNESPVDQVAASLTALESVLSLVAHISDITPTGVAALPEPFDQVVFWSELSTTLFPDLLSTYLSNHHRALFSLLHFAGVIEFVPEMPSGDRRVRYARTEVNWEQLGTTLSSPSEAINERYAWNLAGEQFKHADLIRVIENCMLSLNVPASIGPPRPGLLSLVDEESVIGGDAEELEIPIIDGTSPDDRAYWKIGAVIVPIANPVGAVEPPSGLAFAPLLQGELSNPIYFSRDIYVNATGTIDGDSTFVIRAYPGVIEIDADPSLTAIDVGAELVGSPEAPWILIGEAHGSRVELEGFSVGYSLRGPLDDLESILNPRTTSRDDSGIGLRLVVDLSDLGFLAPAADAEMLVLEADVAVGWSSATGFTVNGSASFQFELPANLGIGPLSIDRVLGGLRATAHEIAIELGAAVSVEVGPVAARFDRIGLVVDVTSPADGSGLWDSLEPSFSTLVPTGLSLALDAGIVTGSGLLDIDRDEHRYTGSFSISVGDFRVAAFGMLQTHLPQPGPEYSLLIVFAAEFSGVQVGFGITLNGISGLVGLHRGAAAQELRREITAGTVGNLLTLSGAADDPGRFLTSLNTIFPVRPGRHIIGIGAQLRWAKLVRLDLMIAIELPGPTKVLLLGTVRAEVKSSSRELLRLRLDVLGIIDFEKKLLSIDAALVDSSLLDVFAIDGGAAIRMSWGSQPYLVMSAGGFHPDFVPEPVIVPMPRRVGMSAGKPDGRIYYRLDGYFAITPNTLQFGAHAEIRVNASPLKASGSLGFDVLVQFDPFGFTFDFRARFRVSLKGVTLAGASVKGTLTGPGPMVFRGKVCIEILFFSACWSGSVKLGSSVSQPAVTIGSVAEELRSQITATNLATTQDRRPSVTVELGTDLSGRPVIAPDGRLTWTQTRAPFGLPLDKFEGSPLSRPVVLTTSSGSGTVNEWFAPAGFADYSDAEAINLPAFERLPGGIDLSGVMPTMSTSVNRTVEVEEIILPDIVRPLVAVLAFPSWLFAESTPVVPLLAVAAEQWRVLEGDATEVMSQGRAVSQHWARAKGTVAVPAGDSVEVGGL